MELFKNTNFDFLGYKWPFIIASLVLTVAGLGSIAVKGGIKCGIDFRSGAMMYVKFTGPPPVEKIRSALSSQLGSVDVQSLTGSDSNEVIIETELKDEKALEQTRGVMVNTLTATFGACAAVANSLYSSSTFWPFGSVRWKAVPSRSGSCAM